MDPTSQPEPTWTPLARLGGPGDGPDRFRLPSAVAFSPDGALLAVADGGNHRVALWRRDGDAWRPESIFGARGDGPGAFQFPAGVAFESADALLVADQGNHRICRWERRDDGWVPAGALGGHGAAAGRLDTPVRIACCAAGRTLLAADAGNGRVAAWSRDRGRAWAAAPHVVSSVPSSRPHGVACAADGLAAAVADVGARRVVVLSRPDADAAWAADAALEDAALGQPVAAAFAPDGAVLLVADAAAHAVLAWIRGAEGWRAAGAFGGKGDGPDQFRYPAGIAIDPSGTLLAVADSLNHRVSVWEGGGR